MLSSMFSAFSFVPLENAYGSTEEYAKFKERLASDTSLGANETEKKEFELLKGWLSNPKRAHIE